LPLSNRRWAADLGVSVVIQRLVIATHNTGKLAEFELLLADFVGEVISQRELGIPAIAETESTFVGNALLKARYAAKRAQCAALADDSGLEVDALGGAPGVYSARYAGEGASDAVNNARLLDALRASPAPRTARYRTVLALVLGPEDPTPMIVQGVWEGEIVLEPRGQNGFGYDPLFWVPALSKTAAELSLQEKNELSHRAQAMRTLQARLASE
jgi:XTP/dITP diphosphohydrolase